MSQAGDFVVLRLSRLPSHFGENEICGYLRQFGKVGGIYMPRSKKTLKRRGYAFVKVPKEIAPIIMSTLDGVLNFNKIMECKIVSNPRWNAFRRRPLIKSSRAIENKRQIDNAIRRVTRSVPQDTSRGKLPQTTAKNHALRRRTRSFNKRVELIRKSNGNFVFHSRE
ncbi:hypothetical protein EG68_07569 [Paragonimus skrjabini miyazakii]|uniref:RRM domain-containing protein n=1 Tax=Paragonimus skrjabini miyazakii TaxID=59628 RepID=A0A8S9YKC3_9TREM|nr:hypothetical protein EG68_07569 [Paragonimus skrjabini miyazakii]